MRRSRPRRSSRPTDGSLGHVDLQGFLASAPTGIVLCDRTGHIRLVNLRILQEFGYREGELIGRPLELLLPERMRDVHAAHRDRFAQDPRPRGVAGRELMARRSDGTEFPVEVGLSSYGQGEDLMLAAVMVDISARKAAEEQTRRAAERLESLHRIDRAILGSTSIDELVTAALERIRDLVGAERAAFVWFDHEEQVAVYLGAVEDAPLGPAPGSRIPFEEFPAATLDPTGPPTFRFDLEDWQEPSPLGERLRAGGLRSVVAATIVQDDRVVGDLLVSSTRPDAFTDGDLDAVEEVASQLAVAVRQGRLREELIARATTLEQRERQQAAVARLGLLALEESDLDVLFHRAVVAVAETMDVPFAKVLELLPEDEAFALRAGVGWSGSEVGRTLIPAGEDSQAGFTLQSGWPVVVEDLETETRFHGPRLLIEHGVVSGMSVIIGSPSEPWGVLGAHTKERRSFTSEDVDFLTSVAGVLGAAVERVQAREDIVRRTRRLEGLREIDARMLAAASPPAVAEAVLGIIRRQIPCDHATVWSVEADDVIDFLAVWNREEMAGGPAAGTELPIGEVVPEGEGWHDVYEPDIRAFAASNPILGWAKSAGLRTVLVCHLTADGELLGGITIASGEIDAFDREQRETIREAADHLALALRKARADEELSRHAADLRRLAEERRTLLARLVRAQEEERQRVAHELHDGLGQVLTSVSLFAGDLEDRVPEDVRPRVKRLQSLIAKAVADSRRLVWSMHPPELDRLGLVSALEHLVADVSNAGTARVELEARVGDLRLPAEAEAVAYRIVQEALNNAQKHARAANIRVALTRDPGRLSVAVRDDGRGFDPDRTTVLGIGLPGMRERAELIGASLVVSSTEGEGTTIRLDLPLDL